MYYNINDFEEFLKGFAAFEGSFSDEDVEDYICNLDRSKTIDFDYDFGATKMVIIPEKGNYVLKIPFNEGFSEGDWFSFDRNYCEEEISIYFAAKEAGFQNFFLPLERKKWHEYYIYFQLKATVYNSNYIYGSKEAREIIRTDRKNSKDSDIIYALNRIPLGWLASCLDCFNQDMKKFYNFIYFLIDNNIISDLHESNVGWYKKFPVIIDYGGYFE